MNAPLVLPRRLTIQILHEAQIALPGAIHGWVYEREGQPVVFRLAAADMGTHRADESLWARLWSKPDAPAVPLVSELRENLYNLIVSLNTKGVLELRAWELAGGAVAEREIRIAD
jgi:[CysO sulfur-carrier protein]-S-L-cysteine hydrolase